MKEQMAIQKKIFYKIGERKVKKNEKNCKKRLAFFYTDDIIILALQIQAPLAQLVEQ